MAGNFPYRIMEGLARDPGAIGKVQSEAHLRLA
jgi:hypothetical protein